MIRREAIDRGGVTGSLAEASDSMECSNLELDSGVLGASYRVSQAGGLKCFRFGDEDGALFNLVEPELSSELGFQAGER